MLGTQAWPSKDETWHEPTGSPCWRVRYVSSSGVVAWTRWPNQNGSPLWCAKRRRTMRTALHAVFSSGCPTWSA